MKIGFRVLSIFVFFAGFANSLTAQLKAKSYSVGYRLFEMEDFGNNPFNIAPILKDPQAYTNYLNSIRYTGFSANPAPVRLNLFYLNGEFHKPGSLGKFWKKHTVQAGLVLSTRQKTFVGSLDTRQYVTSPDTTVYDDSYSLTRNTQLVGLNAGLNRRFRISNRFSMFAAVQVQGSIAFVHHVKQQLDSSRFTTRSGWTTKTRQLPDLKAKNYFQWQVMLPLGVEYRIYRNTFFARLELIPALIGGRYRPDDFASLETLGVGVSVIYQRPGK